MLFLESVMADGRHLVLAVKIVDEETKAGEVVMIGVGVTPEEARTSVRNNLMLLGYPEHEATYGECVWRAPLQ